METLNNPENQEKLGQHDLGQITLRHDLITIQNLECWIKRAKQDAETGGNAADTAYYLGQIFAYDHILKVLKNGFDAIHTTSNAHNPSPWVVVENAGDADEKIIAEFKRHSTARHWKDDRYGINDPDTKVMLRNEDGTLTTEF